MYIIQVIIMINSRIIPAGENENASCEIISKLIAVGGKEMIMMNNDYYVTVLLHLTCWNESTSFDIISKLLEVGGRELVMTT